MPKAATQLKKTDAEPVTLDILTEPSVCTGKIIPPIPAPIEIAEAANIFTAMSDVSPSIENQYSRQHGKPGYQNLQ
jgi:hypothetical protein